MNAFFLLGIQLTVFFATTLVLVWFMTRPSPAAKRVAEVTQIFALDRAVEHGTSEGLRTRLLKMIHLLRSRLGFTDNDKIRARFLAAGLREQKSMDLYFALRFLGPLAGILVWEFRFQGVVLLDDGYGWTALPRTRYVVVGVDQEKTTNDRAGIARCPRFDGGLYRRRPGVGSGADADRVRSWK